MYKFKGGSIKFHAMITCMCLLQRHKFIYNFTLLTHNIHIVQIRKKCSNFDDGILKDCSDFKQ